MRLLIAALAFLLLVGAGSRPAHAEDKATKTARKHYEKGQKLFALRRFDEALVAYEAAFEAKPLPGFLFNIGQCHRNLGDYDAAIFTFRKYLKLDPEAENREAVLELLDELQALKDEQEAEKQNKILAPPPRPEDGPRDDTGGKPIYKKWWFWGGVAAVAGAGVGTYLLVRDDGVPDSDLGHVVFR
jgi:tetratricopeptide (TPR) repeat protein